MSVQKSTIEIDRDELRAEHDSIIVPKTGRSRGRFHICGMLGPYCGTQHHKENTSMRIKPIEVFPKGYWDWCKTCAYVREFGRLPPANNPPEEVVYID